VLGNIYIIRKMQVTIGTFIQDISIPGVHLVSSSLCIHIEVK
jgi:hypothetical protein